MSSCESLEETSSPTLESCCEPLSVASKRSHYVEFLHSSHRHEIPIRVFGVQGTFTPVIMFHGLESHSGWFTHSAGEMASAGFPVYSFDRRGSGLSCAPRGDVPSVESLIQDASTVIRFVQKRHELGRVHLLGHCFGTLPATLTACELPDSVLSLVLAAPAFFVKTKPTFGDRVQILRSVIQKESRRLPVPFPSELLTEDHERLEFIKNDPFAVRDITAQTYWNAWRAQQRVKSEWSKIVSPILALLPDKDQIGDTERNKRFVQSLRSGEKKIIRYPRAKHILEFSDERENFIEDLRAWLVSFER